MTAGMDGVEPSDKRTNRPRTSVRMVETRLESDRLLFFCGRENLSEHRFVNIEFVSLRSPGLNDRDAIDDSLLVIDIPDAFLCREANKIALGKVFREV